MIVIVDYGLGNLFSVAKAFEMLGAAAKISSDPADIAQAERIVLPGVGAFGDGMAYLKAKGLDQALTTAVMSHKKPFFGICLGMQFLADTGYEFGEHQGLGWVPGSVRKLEVESQGLKVPHIGWNAVAVTKESPLWKGIKNESDFYFLHSYQLVCDDPTLVAGTTVYGETITAAITHDNIFATQFHPEKSQTNGLKLLENFIHWTP